MHSFIFAEVSLFLNTSIFRLVMGELLFYSIRTKTMRKRRLAYRLCPLCGGNKTVLVAKATTQVPPSPVQIQVTDKFFGLHGDIVTCLHCGFHYVGRGLYVKKIVNLYKAMSDEGYLQEEKERRRSFVHILNTIERIRGGKKGKIMDIGCCTGGLLVEARVRGWKTTGIDPSVWAVKKAKKLHKLSIANETIETYSAKSVNLDAVTILDVLEHVENPKKILQKIYKILSRDGIFCVVTPDYGSIARKILGDSWWGIRLAHVSYFRLQDLRYLFEKTGFEVVKQKTYVRFFSLYYIFVRLLPAIEDHPRFKSILKNITVPLVFFDTFEFYLKKAPKAVI